MTAFPRRISALVLGPGGALWVGTEREAWRGSTRTGAGRPIARPSPMTASQTISIQARWYWARMAPFGSGHKVGLARLDKDGSWQNYNPH